MAATLAVESEELSWGQPMATDVPPDLPFGRYVLVLKREGRPDLLLAKASTSPVLWDVPPVVGACRLHLIVMAGTGQYQATSDEFSVVAPHGDARSKIFSSSVNGDPIHTGDFDNIPGLKLVIPVAATTTKAAISFSLPQPYAEGTDFPGGSFRLKLNDSQVAEGSFTYPMQEPRSFGRMPLTLSAVVDLPPESTSRVEVEWAGIRGSKVHLGGSASLTAILE